MKKIAVGIGLVLCAGLVAAQEPLPQERAQQAAKLLAAEAAKLTDVPVKTDGDTEKPFGLKKGERTTLVIPDKGLSEDRLGKVDKDVLSVGQLWLRGLTPVVAGTATPADKLQLVKVKANDGEHELSLLLLGARKGAEGKLELLVYAKAKEPLLVLPLEAASGSQNQPIELEGKKAEGDTGVLEVRILGKYQAGLPVSASAP